MKSLAPGAPSVPAVTVVHSKGQSGPRPPPENAPEVSVVSQPGTLHTFSGVQEFTEHRICCQRGQGSNSAVAHTGSLTASVSSSLVGDSSTCFPQWLSRFIET